MVTDAVASLNSKPKPSWLFVRLAALRAFSLPVSVLPVVAAVAAAVPFSKWNWPVLIASSLGAGLLHLTGNLLNDYFDFRSGVDHREEGDENRPGRQLVKGQLRPKDILAEAMLCLMLAGVLTAYLIWQCGPDLLWFGLAAGVSLYIYTGPPLALKYHALGEALIFLTFGPILLLGAAYAQTHQLELSALLVSLPVGLATTAILVGNNVRDRDEDRSAGIKTLSRVIGHNGLRALYVTLVILSVIGLAAMAAVGAAPRFLLASPLLLVLLAGPLKAVIKDERLSDIDAQTARFETILLAMIIVVFAMR